MTCSDDDSSYCPGMSPCCDDDDDDDDDADDDTASCDDDTDYKTKWRTREAAVIGLSVAFGISAVANLYFLFVFTRQNIQKHDALATSSSHGLTQGSASTELANV